MKLKKTVKQFHAIRDNVDQAAWWFDRGDYKNAGAHMFSVAVLANILADILKQEGKKGENNEP